MIFNFLLGPGGVPGEGPDCHFPKEIVDVGQIPARFRDIFNFYFLALSTVRIKEPSPRAQEITKTTHYPVRPLAGPGGGVFHWSPGLGGGRVFYCCSGLLGH